MKKIFFLLFFPLAVSAQMQMSTAQLLDSFMSGQSKYFKFNGTVLVADKGNILAQKPYGYADYYSKRMLNNNSVFELASVSKEFTAMGILILKEKDRLSLDDTLRKFFPELPYYNITIYQLLTHTSGLPDYMDAMTGKWDSTKIAFNKDMIAFLAKEKPAILFKPGEKWEYSNTGYAILGSVIEKVSGMSYNDFLEKNIFKPLGMMHTFVYNTRRTTKKIPDDYALGFVYSDSLKKYMLPDELPDLSMVYWLDGIVGDGCVNSTTGDLFKWDRALYTEKLVSKNSLDAMIGPQVLMSPRDSSSYYGFGFEVQPKTDHGKIVSHTGGWPGYATRINRYVDEDKTIIILSNNETNSANIAVSLESILFNEPVLLPYNHREIKIDTSLLKNYAGKYKAFLTLQVIEKNGKLYRHRNGTEDIELKPESLTKFFYGDGSDRQLEFQLDSNGKVLKVWFINTGQKGEMQKVE